MGDLIHTLPALTDAARQYPELAFDWVAEQSFAEIPSWHPAVEKVIPIQLRRWKHSPLAKKTLQEAGTALRRLRATSFEQIIDAQGLIKSAVLTCLARGQSGGMDWRSCKEGLAGLSYRTRIAIPIDWHAIDRLRELFAKILGYHYDINQIDYGLKRRDFIQDEQQKPFLVFLHGTSAKKKLWSETEWLKLTQLAANQGYEVLLPWGNESERTRAERLAFACPAIRVLSPMNLSQIAGLIAEASGVVGVDTGLAHLAAALGTPAVTLYIASSPQLTGARGQNQICVTTVRSNRLVASKPSSGQTNIRIYPELNAASVWEALEGQIGQAGQAA